MMLRRNVLIFHQAALGDFILTWPTALALARIFPQSRIIYVTPKSKGLLAETVLRIESTDVEAGWHGLFERDIAIEQLDANVRRLLTSAHTAVVFHPPEKIRFAETLKRLVADLRVVQLDTTGNPAMHQADSYVVQAGELQLLGEASRQILAGVRSRGIAFSRKPQIDVLIHPGSGGAAKRWPTRCFIDLAKRLQLVGRSCQFVIGEVEQEQFKLEEKAALTEATHVHSPASYVDLLHRIASAKTFVGNDSGPTHLAAIIGVPTVAIFGPTDPAVWSPIGPSVKVLREQPIDAVSVDAVLAACDALMI